MPSSSSSRSSSSSSSRIAAVAGLVAVVCCSSSTRVCLVSAADADAEAAAATGSRELEHDILYDEDGLSHYGATGHLGEQNRDGAGVAVSRSQDRGTSETEWKATLVDFASSRTSGKGGLAVAPGYLGDSNRAGGGASASSLARHFSWVHTGEPNQRTNLPGNLGFVSEIATREQFSKVRNGQLEIPYGAMGVMAFCGGEDEYFSHFEAAGVFPHIKQQSHAFSKNIENVVICTPSAEWLRTFMDMCPKHTNLGKPEQAEAACDFDAIAVTSNACNVADLNDDINRFADFGKDIWVKEVMCQDDPSVREDDAKNAKFLAAARVALDSHALVKKWSMGRTKQSNTNKADGSPAATIVNGQGLTSNLGAAAAGLPIDDESGTFPCDKERDAVFVKKYKEVTKDFVIEGEVKTLSKTKKKKKSCSWLYKLSQKSDDDWKSQLKFDKMCDNEKKAEGVCVGVCASVCRWAEEVN